MPNTPVHDLLGTLTAPAAGALMWGFSHDATLTTTAVVAHLFGTFMMSPDLDLRTRIYKRWGIFRGFWLPYQKLIPHRSVLSHSGISALLRLAYLFVPILILSLLYPEVRATAVTVPWRAVCFGVVTADIVHTVADYSSTEFKVARRHLREVGKPLDPDYNRPTSKARHASRGHSS